jgi:hypothetical protein
MVNIAGKVALVNRRLPPMVLGDKTNLLTCELLSFHAAVGPEHAALTDGRQPSVARAGEFLVGVPLPALTPSITRRYAGALRRS